MSAWNLVEAEVGGKKQHQPLDTAQGRGMNNTNNTTRNQNGRGRNGSRSNAPRNKNLGLYAVQQIVFLLSAENLSMDKYIRPYMDECGYVPVAYLCNFPNVCYIGAVYEDILNTLEEQCKLDSFNLELDRANEVVRLKENWKMWLFPNRKTGKLGLERYVKAPPPTAEEIAAMEAEAAALEAQQAQAEVDAVIVTENAAATEPEAEPIVEAVKE